MREEATRHNDKFRNEKAAAQHRGQAIPNSSNSCIAVWSRKGNALEHVLDMYPDFAAQGEGEKRIAQPDVKKIWRMLEGGGEKEGKKSMVNFIAAAAFALFCMILIIAIVLIGLFTWTVDQGESIPLIGARWFIYVLLIILYAGILIGGTVGILLALKPAIPNPDIEIKKRIETINKEKFMSSKNATLIYNEKEKVIYLEHPLTIETAPLTVPRVPEKIKPPEKPKMKPIEKPAPLKNPEVRAQLTKKLAVISASNPDLTREGPNLLFKRGWGDKPGESSEDTEDKGMLSSSIPPRHQSERSLTFLRMSPLSFP